MKDILDDHLLEEVPSRSKWFYLFLSLFLAGSVIATLIAWYEVESIAGSGPTMSVIGMILSIYSYKIKIRSLILLGLIPICMSIFWWFCIETFNLSPRDCKINIPGSLSFATFLIFLFGMPFLLDKK